MMKLPSGHTEVSGRWIAGQIMKRTQKGGPSLSQREYGVNVFS